MFTCLVTLNNVAVTSRGHFSTELLSAAADMTIHRWFEAALTENSPNGDNNSCSTAGRGYIDGRYGVGCNVATGRCSFAQRFTVMASRFWNTSGNVCNAEIDRARELRPFLTNN